MALIKWTPFFEPISMFDEFDRFFEDFDFPRSIETRGFLPAIDVYQTADNLIVETPLP
jgi:HSP20 family molecular chaperone IbpA